MKVDYVWPRRVFRDGSRVIAGYDLRAWKVGFEWGRDYAVIHFLCFWIEARW